MIEIDFEDREIVFKDIFRNLCIFLRNNRFTIHYKIDTHSGNSIHDFGNLTHAITQILCSLKICNEQHKVNESIFIIEVENRVKLDLSDILRIADDCIFYHSKSYIENGVVELWIKFLLDDEFMLNFRIHRSLIEQVIYKNSDVIQYSIENEVIFDDTFLENRKDVAKLVQENKFELSKIARKAGSVCVDDMIYFLKIAYWKREIDLRNHEYFLQESNSGFHYDGKFFALSKKPGLHIGMRGFLIDAENQTYFLVMNDISVENGSFSVFEDIFYMLLLRFARKIKVPFVFVSCNSGARIGLYDDLRKILKYVDKKFFIDNDLQNACLKQEKTTIEPLKRNIIGEKELSSIESSNKNSMGNFSKLYVKPGNEENFKIDNKCEEKNVVVLRNTKTSGKVYEESGIVTNSVGEVISIYGNTKTGPENLAFSGLLAGETCLAYNSIMFLSYVTGRSVGIGAYLNKLGERIIQKTKSPLLLTGYHALNKLLQKDVYKSNDEVGGCDVMNSNGNCHREVKNDFEGAEEIIKWIDYYYNSRFKKVHSKKIDIYNEIVVNMQNLKICEDVNLTAVSNENKNVILDEESKMMSKSSAISQSKIIALKQEKNVNVNSYPLTNLSFWAEQYNKTTKKEYFLKKYADYNYFENFSERELLEYLVDSSSLTEYKKKYAQNILIARAKINNTSLGIICSESFDDSPNCESTKNVIFSDSADKISRAIKDFNRENLDILIIANFRGFNGGKEEMEKNILQYGSNIVRSLSESTVRIMVYIPPGGEIRGGSWVVFDKFINPRISIISHPRAMVGILEPEGIANIKFKESQRRDFFAKNNMDFNSDRAQEMANEFCRLHDVSFRMFKNNMIDDIMFIDEFKIYLANHFLV
ncbi:hypothetical protein EDEG_01262 [Edhazardia aedis USNM 41457]|uniref:Acetyl-CoA carboxylase n=1 Tax=Edhazardia aedis (strain USNM 41457) TaxID=1003232 RepID=J9D9T4_EDHAE|nr:hypothetical protein EDEG_01262 [Edhazardia aedis USNM 41457]|eukprot:EJW04521.1 hypothetical protein EDEG_01262 [Edhazardia aedis USNM 41457]